MARFGGRFSEAPSFLLLGNASSSQTYPGLAVKRESELGILFRDGGLLPSFRQGPGECWDRSGDGNGVTSPNAAIIGLATLELAPEALPRLLERGLLILGVLDTGARLELEVLCCKDLPTERRRRLSPEPDRVGWGISTAPWKREKLDVEPVGVVGW